MKDIPISKIGKLALMNNYVDEKAMQKATVS